MIKLNILTLNCWGVFVPFACIKRKERLREIGKAVGQGIYDVVFLQEIWSQSDYQDLCEAILLAMPHTHYFHAGIIGSGLCIFSKHSILETSQYQFSLNGYAHKIFCGDWMGGKSVGLAKLLIEPIGIRVNVYNTHLHAQYSPEKTYNSFDEHRCLQAFELAKFIRDTSSDCDAVIVGGDFNTTPNQIGYKLIRCVGNLEDSWKVQKNTSRAEVIEPTCERPDNCLGPTNTLCPEGVRIDYLFHRQNNGMEVVCESCDLAMRKIPGSELPYSDHEGVGATYTIRKSGQVETNFKTKANQDETKACLSSGILVLKEGINKARYGRRFWLLLAMFLGSILIMMMEKQRLQISSVEAQVCGLKQNIIPKHEQKEISSTTDLSEAQGLPEDMKFCRMGGGQNLHFYIPEAMKLVAITGILFCLVHGLITLTWEIATFESVSKIMESFKC